MSICDNCADKKLDLPICHVYEKRKSCIAKAKKNKKIQEEKGK